MVGMGGAGMSGIAEVLVNRGFDVSGSDLRSSEVTMRLRELGAEVFEGHDAGHVEGADVVVISSAVGASNPEVQEARRRSVPVIRRAEMLAELMRSKLGVAIAGAHGKTTTTSMVASVLAEAGLDPTVVVGGKLNAVNSNAQLGAGPIMVVEADESDGSFLHLAPTVSVVTNIDIEHLDHYRGGLEELRDAFATFLGRLPFYGLAVMCADHPEARRLLPDLDRRVTTYGFSPQADLRATELSYEGSATSFEVSDHRGSRGTHRLRMVGAHNVQNALAALAVSDELGVDPDTARKGLEAFSGVDRRFSVRGERRGVLVVDDYGHHPTEILATIRGARSGHPERRIVAVFQPHRYTRTAHLLSEFGGAFHEAESVRVLPVYAAGEEPIAGADHQAVIAAVRSQGHRDARALSDVTKAAAELAPELSEGDLVIAFGAGDVGRLGRLLLGELEASDKT